MSERVRRCVQFRRANLLDGDALAGRTYDLIFARNLMIYQTAEARQRMVIALATALAADGRLVVGSADWGADLADMFALEQPVQSFALRRKSSETAVDERVKATPAVRESVPPTSAQTLPAQQRAEARAPGTEQHAEAAELVSAAQAASARGEIGTAEWICRQALYLDPANLAALELLGQLERPTVSRRMHLALHARLHRLRSAALEGSAS